MRITVPKVPFVLPYHPDLENAPYRNIIKAADVVFGTVDSDAEILGAFWQTAQVWLP